MANRARRPALRAIHWRPVVAVGVVAWFAVGVIVVVNTLVRPRPAATAPATAAVGKKPSEKLTPAGTGPGGPVAWSAVAAAVVNPQCPFGIPPPVRPGAFAAAVIDMPPPPDNPRADAAVFRRIGDDKPRNPFDDGPPARRPFGTAVNWHESADDAFTRAAADGKLVFLLHLDGSPDADGFFGNNAQFLRTNVFARPAVADALAANFESAVQKVVTLTRGTPAVPGGNVCGYVCNPAGEVVHAVPGRVTAEDLLRELRWAADVYAVADAESDADPVRRRQAVRVAHFARLKSRHRFTLPVDLTPRGGGPFVPDSVVVRHSAVAALPPAAKVHALFAAYPLPSLAKAYPILWEYVLTDR